MDGVNIPYNYEVELEGHVGPMYQYKHWLWLPKYIPSIYSYEICANYEKMKENNPLKLMEAQKIW